MKCTMINMQASTCKKLHREMDLCDTEQVKNPVTVFMHVPIAVRTYESAVAKNYRLVRNAAILLTRKRNGDSVEKVFAKGK